jgi:8-oxo-dGTP pyrophosphatase MutT (NUDIX family)
MSGLIERLKKALELPLAIRSDRPLPPGLAEARPAAVLILFAGDPRDPAVLLTRRTDTVESHKGQIAFPGGVSDPEDFEQHGPITTALRETEEEVGIPRQKIEVIGTLPDLPTFTGFRITPVVGVSRERGHVNELALLPNPDEIAEVFWAELSLLQAPGTYRRELLARGGLRYPIDVYDVHGHRVWGATGAILKNLLDRLSSVRLD